MIKECPDTLTLLSFNAGDLSPEKMVTVEKHCHCCDSCMVRLKSINDNQATFLKENPMFSGRNSTNNLIRFKTRPLYSIAASLLLFLFSGFMIAHITHQNRGFRIKGATELSIYVKATNGTPVKRQDQFYSPGESIQFSYSLPNNQHFALIGVDTSGKITSYYPTDGTTSVLVNSGADIPLPFSIRLDSYLGDELFIGCFSDQLFTLNTAKHDILASFNSVNFNLVKLTRKLQHQKHSYIPVLIKKIKTAEMHHAP